MKKIRPIAIYLPQYHPFKENNEWWGEGFTEWTNVVKGTPRFNGHYQPHLPADLGFYDLRLSEVREKQARMAKDYGIYGFCYYHYWFNGKLLMERPLSEVLELGKPDFPFCMCWANENWTRSWDGAEKQVLIKQEYSVEDDIAHIKYLLKYFKDPRYIRIDGKPVFIIYKEDVLPNVKDTIRVFREEARKEGIDLYLCCFERCSQISEKNLMVYGFDAMIEFQPFSTTFAKYEQDLLQLSLWERIVKKVKKEICRMINVEFVRKDRIVDYEKFIKYDIELFKPDRKCYPCVLPMWDNSARRPQNMATIFKNSTPALFEWWCRMKIKLFNPFSKEENLFFINAWNEWAEGNHLEPDQRWGKQYLEAFERALNG